MLATSPPPRSTASTAGSIRVEVDVAPGLPGFTIVGLADAALQEARERVRGALRNAGFVHPPRRITVNLAPADLRKAGASLDLAIALGILLGSEQVRRRTGGALALIGELSLGGEVRAGARASCRWSPPSPGAACGGSSCRPTAVAEARLVDGIERGRRRRRSREAVEVVRRRRARRAPPAPRRGSSSAARAAPTAARRRRGRGRRTTGGPGPGRGPRPGRGAARRSRSPSPAATALLLIGPPGSGKTLLARTIPGLLPPLDDAAALAATVVASAAGEGPITRARPPAAVPGAAPHDLVCGDGRRRAAPVARRGDAAPTRACCSSTSCPSSGATCSRRSASRSRRAASRSPGSGGRRRSRRGSSSSRR